MAFERRSKSGVSFGHSMLYRRHGKDINLKITQLSFNSFKRKETESESEINKMTLFLMLVCLEMSAGAETEICPSNAAKIISSRSSDAKENRNVPATVITQAGYDTYYFMNRSTQTRHETSDILRNQVICEMMNACGKELQGRENCRISLITTLISLII